MDVRYSLEGFNPNRWLKNVKERCGLTNKEDLYVLGEGNEPFNKGTKGDFHKAEWFRDKFERFGFWGIHLRGLHYRMVHSGEKLLQWDGQREYLNTEQCWDKLEEASKTARILRVVDAHAFADRRTKDPPILNQDKPPPSGEAIGHWVEPPSYVGVLPVAQGAYALPRLMGYTEPQVQVGDYGVYGYNYAATMRPNVVEIWSEKSGDEAIFQRLAWRYGVNFVPNMGYASLTTIKALLRRLETSGVPGVVLYVSDFDPAGQAMPVSVGRHCQFTCWELEELAGEVAPSIRVDNVAVTRELVEELGIPRTPIKEKDPRRARFELTHGEGAVEVDALEATHPGKLEELLEERIVALRDVELEDRVEEAEAEARAVVKAAVEEVMDAHRDKLEDIEERARAIEERYRPLYDTLGEKVATRYQRLADRFDRHMAPLRSELSNLEAATHTELSNLQPELPNLPEAKSPPEEEREWLYDSERSFLEQTQHFRRIQGKG